jgi:geranylgeranyl pyrophosphate synthase/uncharacterized protein with NAD-binding domain and iron-sulfur cluster
VTHVVVLGGGVAGLSAAHELAERGFTVSVYERRFLAGGKARSVPVSPRPGGGEFVEAIHAHEAGAERVDWIPGEHGFRFFPGFYKHVTDTMARIPTPDGGTVADHLVATTRIGISQFGRRTIPFPARFPAAPSDAATVLADALAAFGPELGLEPADLAFFVARTWQLLTSCPERRLAEYERISWWDYTDAETRPEAYQKFLASGFTRSLVAAKARTASTKTVGDMFIQLMQVGANPSASTTDRVLDAPTDQAWIDPWMHHLDSLGVEYHDECTVVAIHAADGQISGVEIEDQEGHRHVVSGDHYVCALPIERVVPLLTDELVALDPVFDGFRALATNVAWMNGLQFYLRRDIPMVHGHMIHIDTPWALTSISQIQFWRPGTLGLYGDPEVQGVLSIDVSDWTEPGLDGRTAAECSREEVGREVWNQLKRSMNVDGEVVLRDEDLVGWFLDPDIAPDPDVPGKLRNSEPLLVNLVDTWRLRPEAATAIPNLFLASDYVRTYTDLATMEGANEAARRAVNAIIAASGSGAAPCQIWPLEEPLLLEPLRRYDSARFEQGLVWDHTLVDLASVGMQLADPLSAAVLELASLVDPVVPEVLAVEGVFSDIEGGRGSRLPTSLSLVTAPVTAGVPLAGSDPAALDDDTVRAGGDVDRIVESTGPTGFQERLAWYRATVIDRLHELIPAGEPAAYLYDPIREFVGRPSKGLRAGLLLASAGAHGGTVGDGLDLAAALELLHNAFLVHDDVEDGSLTRRGRPTLHRTVGIPLAVNIGDAMNAISLRIARSYAAALDPVPAALVGDELDHLLLESLEGQALELGWTRENRCDLDVADYLQLVLKKTAWYSFIHPMRMGALSAGQVDDLDRFNRFGFLLGAAFQIQDDVLNLTGELGRYGKEIGGDLWEGKRTLILTHAFAHLGGRDQRWLERLFATPRERRLPRQLDTASEILTSSGSIGWARDVASSLADAAMREFDTAFADGRPGPDLELVRDLVRYVASRDL